MKTFTPGATQLCFAPNCRIELDNEDFCFVNLQNARQVRHDQVLNAF